MTMYSIPARLSGVTKRPMRLGACVTHQLLHTRGDFLAGLVGMRRSNAGYSDALGLEPERVRQPHFFVRGHGADAFGLAVERGVHRSISDAEGDGSKH